MRLLTAILIGALAGAGAVAALTHDQSALQPGPSQSLFSNLPPYTPAAQYGQPAPPTPAAPAGPAGSAANGSRPAYNYGSGG